MNGLAKAIFIDNKFEGVSMQPSSLNPLGITIFVISVLTIFAFNYPNGYKKASDYLLYFWNVTCFFMIGAKIRDVAIFNKLLELDNKELASKVITFYIGKNEDIIFYFLILIAGGLIILLLRDLHKLNDKILKWKN